MIIQCTRKLLDELKIKPCKIVREDIFFSWHANLIKVNRRKAIILVNDQTRYCIFLYGLRAADIKKINMLILEAIKETLSIEGVREELINKYLESAGIPIFATAQDASVIATMNQLSQIANRFGEEWDIRNINQVNFNVTMGNWIFKINGEYEFPIKALTKAFKKFIRLEDTANNDAVISLKVFQLLITLELDNHDVWRRVIVPANITFKQFHSVIQKVFGWQDYHLHKFSIFRENNAIALLHCDIDEDCIDCYKDDYPVITNTDVKLSEYLPRCKKIEYVYDFGDYWEHRIILEQVIENYPERRIICIDGKGSCPPEDVGGCGGHDEFVEAWNDVKHPDHEEMVVWGKAQSYKEFDIDWVNSVLR